ncbi:MAG TPA: hypothetical protein VN952_01625, partial [Chthoniobacterales bacterium]|nr:hypothetical protein [Chthoniobacterales bacterium]
MVIASDDGKPHHGRAGAPRPPNPAHGLTPVSREPLKGYDGSSREIPVATFFGLTGCWHALDSAGAERQALPRWGLIALWEFP